MNTLEFTGERLVPGQTSERILKDHVAQYEYVIRSLPLGGRSILDVACGVGFGSKLFAERTPAVVTGVDVSVSAIAHGQQRYSHPKVRYCVADATRLPFADLSFEAVISLETIEHLVDHEAFLSETNRVLRAHGLFVVSTPNKAVTSPGRSVPLNPYHVREFSHAELSALLGQYYSRMEWLGQHFVPRPLANRPARKLLYVLSRRLARWGGPDLESRIYTVGGSFDVRPLSRVGNLLFRPRNMLVVCHKD